MRLIHYYTVSIHISIVFNTDITQKITNLYHHQYNIILITSISNILNIRRIIWESQNLHMWKARPPRAQKLVVERRRCTFGTRVVQALFIYRCHGLLRIITHHDIGLHLTRHWAQQRRSLCESCLCLLFCSVILVVHIGRKCGSLRYDIFS